MDSWTGLVSCCYRWHNSCSINIVYILLILTCFLILSALIKAGGPLIPHLPHLNDIKQLKIDGLIKLSRVLDYFNDVNHRIFHLYLLFRRFWRCSRQNHVKLRCFSKFVREMNTLQTIIIGFVAIFKVWWEIPSFI